VTTPSRSPVLELSGLGVELRTGGEVVEDVDLRLAPGEILGLVGESGAGKTTTALALLGYSDHDLAIASGSLAIEDRPLCMDDSMRPLRGAVISYVPQDPGRALNPSLRIRDALADVLNAHGAGRGETSLLAPIFDRVGLPATPEFGRRFPHQLSGGQQQRVCIALALSCDPAVLVLDEPTTGLDVVTQAKILAELIRLRDEEQISMVYVTHDLAVVAQIADRIAVMYAGRLVEQGPADVILRRPRHPYTRGLLASIPDHIRPSALEPMPGIAVGVGERPPGCAFASRCPQATDRCVAELPPLGEIGDRHEVRCFHWHQTPAVEPIPPQPRVLREGEGPPVLEVDGVTTIYRSRRETVVAARDVSFAVASRSCVALVGESGSGKTTIARAIAGLHPAESGRIVLGGEVLPGVARRRTVEQRRASSARVPEPRRCAQPSPERTRGDRPAGAGAARDRQARALR
jgi:peptide/nickel transport system ATP-binding protein